MTEEKLQPVEIARQDLADPASFELTRKEIYDSTKAGPERSELLTQLAGSIATKFNDSGEPVSLHERVMDMLTAPEPLETAKGSRYRISLSPNGDVLDIARIKMIEEDPRAVVLTRRSAKHIGWGPKQNHSSFKTHLSNLPRGKVRV
jgi:hypothetical protein